MYRPRDAEHTVLHQVVTRHLEAFLGAAAEAGDEAGLPQFVEREFRGFLRVGPGRAVLDRVFTDAPGGELAFDPAPAPSDAEVAAVLARIRRRVQRLLVHRGLEPADEATGPADRLAEESPVLAGFVGASVQGRVALGERAGRRVRRLGEARHAEGPVSRRPRRAHLDGFDLHANVWVGANDRAGVERLCRYILRPPFAQERPRLRSDDCVALELKLRWHDGTRELVFEPLEFLERLAAMTPRPETNLLICHGVLAPRARWRERVPSIS